MIRGLSSRPSTRPPAISVLSAHPAVTYYQGILRLLDGTGPAETPGRTLGITSCAPREGVSMVATNLALVAATESPEQQVLLVDTNVTRPALQREFEIPLAPGVTDVLLERCDLLDAIRPSPLGNLSLLTAGENTSPLRGQQEVLRIRELLGQLAMQFDLIILDLPPATQASRTLSVAGLVDGVLLVVAAERVAWETAQQTKQWLVQSRAQVLGVVLNEQREYVPNWIGRRL